jgi:hypothetical protein
MKKIPLFPRPVSWLSAVLLYVFLGLWMTFVGAVLPRLVAIGEESPRLAILGYLALWISPIPFVAIGHHVVHLFLDRADHGATKGRGLLPDLTSWWAGVFAWLVIAFASSVVAFLLLALNPPERDGMLLAARMLHAFAWPFSGAPAGLHTVAWVLVAAQLYDLEHAVKARAARGEA